MFKKNDIPIVNINMGKDYLISPYDASKLDYHNFKLEGESKFAYTKGDWYLKYKQMFDFRCKEPFFGGGPTYLKNDYPKISYQLTSSKLKPISWILIFASSSFIF